MKLRIKVKPGALQNKIEEGNVWTVWVKEKAKDGKANQAVIKLLSKHLSVPSSAVSIIAGTSSRNKLIKIS
ncbi:MAG: DUF167 domain-containing protein [Candidatus Altiarchaeota archaeon]|nr:DUF167 domain-containing protein [Candidatus Altiarchaeota archaeon]